MERSKWGAGGRVLMVMVVAAAMVVIWLWGTCRHAHAGGASDTASSGAAQPNGLAPASGGRSLPWESASASRYSDIGTTWSSTTPVTTAVTAGTDWKWVIAQHGVTITFQSNSISEDAVFTFTPKVGLSLDPPLSSAPYFFELTGVYKEFGNPLSLWHDIYITLEYDEAALGDIEEGTLDAFHLEWNEWTSEGATVDTQANRLTWSTKNLGTFGVGGFAHVVFLPLVCNGVSTE